MERDRDALLHQVIDGCTHSHQLMDALSWLDGWLAGWPMCVCLVKLLLYRVTWTVYIDGWMDRLARDILGSSLCV